MTTTPPILLEPQSSTNKKQEDKKLKTISEWITTTVIDPESGKQKLEQFELVGKLKKGGKEITFDYADAISLWRKKQKKFSNTLLHNKKRWLNAKKELNFEFAKECPCATCTNGASHEEPNIWCKNLNYIKVFYYICCCLLFCDSGLNLLEEVGECQDCPRCCVCNLTNTKCDDCKNKSKRFWRCRHLIDHSPCLFYDKMTNDLTDDEQWIFNDNNDTNADETDAKIPLKKFKSDISKNEFKLLNEQNNKSTLKRKASESNSSDNDYDSDANNKINSEDNILKRKNFKKLKLIIPSK